MSFSNTPFQCSFDFSVFMSNFVDFKNNIITFLDITDILVPILIILPEDVTHPVMILGEWSYPLYIERSLRSSFALESANSFELVVLVDQQSPFQLTIDESNPRTHFITAVIVVELGRIRVVYTQNLPILLLVQVNQEYHEAARIQLSRTVLFTPVVA